MSADDRKTRWEKVERSLLEEPSTREDDQAFEVAHKLASQGHYPAGQIERAPAMAAWLARTQWRVEPMPAEAMEKELQAYLDSACVDGQPLSREQVVRLLREFRHRQLMRIFLREIEGASLRQTTAEVSDLAQISLEIAFCEAARFEGEPSAPQHLCAMGMGKLGGRELNFSSDVDLILAADDEYWAVDGGAAAERVAKTAVALIDEMTERGRVFRVDLRLRPEGSRGRLVPSESGLIDYYLTWGRTWERGAWLKARAVAGNKEIGERILNALEPFLYRRRLDFEAIDELRRMKEMVDAEAKSADFFQTRSGESEGQKKSAAAATSSPFKARLLKKFGNRGGRRNLIPDQGDEAPRRIARGQAPQGWDVKLGRGGIREIEFFVQALQLVHCGLRPELRVRTTLEALDRLLYAGLVSARAHGELADAYDLFRRLEHRVQMKADRQSHRLPATEEGFEELAQRMGVAADELRASVLEARKDVRHYFDRLFQESERVSQRPTVGEEAEGVLEQIIGLSSERILDDQVIERLEEAGFSRPRQVAGQLQVLRRKGHGPFSESPTSADPQVARYLVRAVREAPDPEGALGQLLRFATSVGDAPSMWSMLANNPHAARLLIHLFGSSPPLGGLLAAEPEMFERLIYSGSAQVVRRREEMDRDLTQRLAATGDRARRLGRIHRFHREEIVRLALHEVAGSVEVEQTCRQLTDVAELVIEALFREVVREFGVGQKDMEIGDDPLSSVGLAVVGMGKLGGGEMGFGSDLDFFFVYDSAGPVGLDHQRATQLARRLVRVMSTPATADLYEVDLRLRPSGSQGTLVVSLDAWCDYHRRRAKFWERLALLRARPLTGPLELREQIEARRQELAIDRPIPKGALQGFLEIREQLADSAQGGGDRFDLKFDEGGLLDLEFSAQWLQLRGAGDQGVRKARSTFEVLRALQDAPGRPAGAIDLERMGRDYAWLRRLESRLAISGLGKVVPEQGPARRALVRQMGHQGRGGDAQFQTELENLRRRVTRVWKTVSAGDEERSDLG